MNIPVMQSEIGAARTLAGKVSLVTGSTSGIGLGIARALARAGSDVVLMGSAVTRTLRTPKQKLPIISVLKSRSLPPTCRSPKPSLA